MKPPHFPLHGIRIVTVEHFGAGPYGTMFLAGLGAEVIKVENAATGGDTSRHVGPRLLGEDDSEYFQCLNLWKKSVSLDLKKDFEKFKTLVASADAVVNNLRGDVPAKLGLDYKSLSRQTKSLFACISPPTAATTSAPPGRATTS